MASINTLLNDPRIETITVWHDTSDAVNWATEFRHAYQEHIADELTCWEQLPTVTNGEYINQWLESVPPSHRYYDKNEAVRRILYHQRLHKNRVLIITLRQTGEPND